MAHSHTVGYQYIANTPVGGANIRVTDINNKTELLIFITPRIIRGRP